MSIAPKSAMKRTATASSLLTKVAKEPLKESPAQPLADSSVPAVNYESGGDVGSDDSLSVSP